MIVRIKINGGTHTSKEYYYVLGGDRLIPLPDCATNKRKDDDYEYYTLDENNLQNKPIVAFVYSNSGNLLSAEQYTVYDFDEKGDPIRERGKEVEVSDYVKKILLSANEKQHLDEFLDVYVEMIKDVKSYLSKFGVKLYFMGHARRVKDAYSDEFPSSCLPQYKGEVMCLKNVKRWIYQIWIMKLIFEGLGTTRFNKRDNYEQTLYIRLEQSKPYPSAYFATPKGNALLWFEFQPTEGTHLAGLIYGQSMHVRPDIIWRKG